MHSSSSPNLKRDDHIKPQHPISDDILASLLIHTHNKSCTTHSNDLDTIQSSQSSHHTAPAINKGRKWWACINPFCICMSQPG